MHAGSAREKVKPGERVMRVWIGEKRKSLSFVVCVVKCAHFAHAARTWVESLGANPNSSINLAPCL